MRGRRGRARCRRAARRLGCSSLRRAGRAGAGRRRRVRAGRLLPSPVHDVFHGPAPKDSAHDGKHDLLGIRPPQHLDCKGGAGWKRHHELVAVIRTRARTLQQRAARRLGGGHATHDVGPLALELALIGDRRRLGSGGSGDLGRSRGHRRGGRPRRRLRRRSSRSGRPRLRGSRLFRRLPADSGRMLLRRCTRCGRRRTRRRRGVFRRSRSGRRLHAAGRWGCRRTRGRRAALGRRDPRGVLRLM